MILPKCMIYHQYMLIKELSYIQLLDYEDMVRRDRGIPRIAFKKLSVPLLSTCIQVGMTKRC